MAELNANALTTKDRVKTRLQISGTGHDTFIERLINAASDFIERKTQRNLTEATYSDEEYTMDARQEVLYLNNGPVTAITSLEYRTGTPDNPTWTAFQASEYELIKRGGEESTGVRIYGGTPRGTNTIRATYTAGYKKDFTQPTDPAQHNLPTELTDLCERLVAKAFRRRNSEGKSREANENSSVDWSTQLEAEDKELLARYARPVTF